MIRRDRTFTTIVVTGALALILAAIHPASKTDRGLSEEKYNAVKMLRSNGNDIVFAGDSRTLHGISPAAVKEIILGKKIFNFGFSGVGFSKEYLQWVAGQMATNTFQKTIVLGVTPMSLTPRAYADNEFLSLRSMNQTDLRLDLYLADISHFFSPYTINQLVKIFIPAYLGKKEATGIAERFEDGWIKQKIPKIDTELSTENYLKGFQNNVVADVLVNELLLTVEDLKGRGFRIIGFRPPTTLKLRDLENKLSGFDEQMFRRRFEEAGGEWISFRFENYQTSDGSHLDGDSAILFSRDLARAINR